MILEINQFSWALVFLQKFLPCLFMLPRPRLLRESCSSMITQAFSISLVVMNAWEITGMYLSRPRLPLVAIYLCGSWSLNWRWCLSQGSLFIQISICSSSRRGLDDKSALVLLPWLHPQLRSAPHLPISLEAPTGCSEALQLSCF